MKDIPDNINVSSKILLVYEEYSEVLNAQTLLQKVGFDVLAITTEYTLSENVLSFNPDIIVAHGRSGKVTTLGVGRRLREMTRWQGKVLLVLPQGYKPNPQDFAKIRADMLLEAPIPPPRLVQMVGKMLGIDEAVLQERLNKYTAEAAKSTEAGGGTSFSHGEGLEKNNSTLVVGGTIGREDAQFLTGGGEEAKRKELLGAIEDVDEQSFLNAKAKFELDILSEGEKPTEKEQDLEALWTELSNHSELNITPEDEVAARAVNKKVNFDLNEHSPEERREEEERLRKELLKAQNASAERVSKYGKFIAQIRDFDPHQSLSKMASRKVQQDIAKGWNHKEIESQDELRRHFTKALFRKK